MWSLELQLKIQIGVVLVLHVMLNVHLAVMPVHCICVVTCELAVILLKNVNLIVLTMMIVVIARFLFQYHFISRQQHQ